MDLALLLAVVTLVLWASSNFIDKILISRYFKDGTTSVLMIYSGLIGIVAAPVFFLFDTDALNVGATAAMALFGAGLVNGFAIWTYLRALTTDDASTVIPFYQLIPIFGLITGYFLLGEVFTPYQLFWGGMIVLGGLLLSVDIGGAKYSIKWRLLAFVLMSSALFAMYETIFKLLALEEGFWIAAFWQSIGLAAVGTGIVLFPRPRREFLSHVRESGTTIFGLNFVNEIITTVGNATYAFLLLLAPIAIVMLTHVYQGAVVFVLGLLLSIMLPSLIREDRRPKILAQKLLAIGVITTSSYLLFIPQ